MFEKLLKTVFKNLNFTRDTNVQYTVFDSISFISVARKAVCIILKHQSRQRRKCSNLKMLHECGYYLHDLCQFTQLAI